MDIIKAATLTIDASTKYQQIDGFGVNINSKYWDNGRLRPVLDLLTEDLGAVLFRLDHFGRANWMDPDGSRGPSVLTRRIYDTAYQSPDFQNALGMARYLNEKGIEPYLTVSGIVPPWMCANDGETLSAFDLFADMTVDYLCWMRKNGVRFHLFGPLNETDFGPPEGPRVNPFAYRSACRSIVTRLNETGLEDVQLVVAEQGDYNLDYVTVLLEDELLRDRIGVIGMHAYSDFHTGALLDLASEKAPAARCWMTEFGDLDQDASREDRIAWVCMERLFRLLTDGMHGAMLWDAFDNYHDHDDAWTTFGLLQNAWDLYIPKKRYFALKHLFRYVRPGFRRIAAYASLPEIPVLAFQGPDTLTVVGMNPLNEGIHLDLDLGWRHGTDGLKYLDFDAYRTSAFENCARITTPIVKLKNHAGKGFEFTALPHSIFTVTNIKNN